jgi:Spy/CpxP family protein refolding chaperone
MARPSPITLGLSALMLGILTLAVWLFARPRHPVAEAPPPEPTLEADENPGRAPPAPAPTPPAPARRPAPAPVVAVEPPPPAPAPDTTDAGEPPPRMPFALRRDLLVKNHNLRMSEADEETFRALNLPEATRARIREINEAHRLRTERTETSAAPPATGASVALTAAEARQVALRQLLGPEGAQQFDAEERAAVRKLRGKYRFEWGRQLRE